MVRFVLPIGGFYINLGLYGTIVCLSSGYPGHYLLGVTCLLPSPNLVLYDLYLTTWLGRDLQMLLA